jgi:N-acetylglucosaminyldiphosphoundecaprenol N-acetyl-beta-D-mannosaminyltransferase
MRGRGTGRYRDGLTLGGLRLFSGPVEDAVCDVLATPGGRAIHFVNSYSWALAQRDFEYREVMAAGHCFADGLPLTLLTRKIYPKATFHRTRGPDFFSETLRQSGPSARHFFIGGTVQTLERIVERAKRENPHLVIVGTLSPPFRALSPEDVESLEGKVRQARPDLVWVGLGTPRQDGMAKRLAESLNCTCLAVGAAFDFYAGTKREAPRVVQMVGMEWIFRFLMEPRRLWRRYLVWNLRFVVCASRLVLRDRGSRRTKEL